MQGEEISENKIYPKTFNITTESNPHDDDHSNQYYSPQKDKRRLRDNIDQYDEIGDNAHKEWPEMPAKTVLLTLFLTLVGLGFTIAGIICYFENAEGSKTITFFLFGIFLCIPGCYYGIFLIQAYKAETPQEREEILDEIPI
jgi:hypothetical protein